MTTLPGRLGTLTAADIMTRNVTVVRTNDTLATAVHTLRDAHVTGAPVVDEQGRLVGILSISDLVVRPLSTEDGESVELPPVPLAHGVDRTTWDLFDQTAALDHSEAADTVADRMSKVVTAVTQDAPLVEVARAMCDGHWHRVPVVDGGESLQGIISTMDVLDALVNAADEAS